jgi:hypothetical protein
LTLTLRLQGQGSTANVQAPDLAKRTDITENFKTYPPTEEAKGQSCAFTYTIRATKAGSIEFPSLPAAFFDVNTEQFVTKQSKAITLEIEDAPALNVPVSAAASETIGGGLERSAKGLFANITDASGAVNQAINYLQWATAVVSLAAIYAVIAAFSFFWRQRRNDPKVQRRRNALSRAKKRLNAQARNADPSASAQDVIFGYVADLTDGIEDGMTVKDVCGRLQAIHVPESTIERVRQLLETLDAVRFSGGVAYADENLGEVKKLLEKIERTILT